MNAAILCPGPSLLRTYDPAAVYGLRIAVNRASLMVPCDWLAALDHPLIRDELADKLRPRPKLLTNNEGRRHFPDWEGVTTEQLFGYCQPVGIGWSTYTKTAAILFAAYKGATRIDVYGDDQTNAPDADGYAAKENRRDEERWHAERTICNKLDAWLRERAVRVYRILSYGQS